MGNDLKVGSQPKGPAANPLLSNSPISAGSAQQLSAPLDLLGLPDRSEQPGIAPQLKSGLQPPAALLEAGEEMDIDVDDDADIDGKKQPGLLLEDLQGDRDRAPRAPASATGPYRELDYLEFRRRHYESAQQVVDSFEKHCAPDDKAALGRIKAELADALSDFNARSGQVVDRRARPGARPATFNDMATLVGGKSSPTKWGWVRCLFSSNARRARTIQTQARQGIPFRDIYRGNKLANIHPKAALALFIRGRLKEAGLGDRDWAATAQISKQLGKSYLELTQKSEAWRTYTFQHDFSSVDGGQSLAMTSRLTPAAQLPALVSGYSDGRRGISSMNSKERTHPANFWMTEFKPAEQSAAQLSFKGFRHGVLDAYGLKEPAERKPANQAKVAELVRAAGSEIPSACERQSDGSWLIPMVSVSLQTHGKETGMIEGQKAAWTDVAKSGIVMEGPAPDGSVGPWTLKPTPITFSVGVNWDAMNLRGHWKTASFGNNDAIKALIETARASRDRLSFGNPQEAIRKKAITELIGQIEAMHNSGAYRREGQNPYKLAARVLVLAQLSGLVPCFNCKSGKDRTGMVDVEVKSLIQSINENIQSHGAAALSVAAVADEPGSPSIVPSYATGRTDEQKAVFKDLHLNGGSQQVSLATTGLMGNKTESGYLRNNLNRDEATLRLIAGFARNADGNKG